MKQVWHGLRDDLSIVGDGLLVSNNTLYFTENQISQRPGLTGNGIAKLANSMVLLVPFRDKLLISDGTTESEESGSSLDPLW